jgi:hypothetical protein
MANVKAGGAYIELFTKDSGLIKGLTAADAKLKSLGASLAGIGARMTAAGGAAIGTLTAAAYDFAKAGATIDDAAQRTGLSAEAISSLGFAAEMSGADLGQLEAGITKMKKKLAEAADGSTGAQEDMKNLGLTWEQLASQTPEEQLKTFADRIAEIKNPTRQAAAAMSIFGKGGVSLLPFLRNGADGIADLQAEADRLGITFSSADATAAAEFDDSMDRLIKTTRRAWQSIGAALAPALTNAANSLAGAAATVGQWITANRPLIVMAATVAAAIAGIGLALVTAGGLAIAAGAALGGLAAIFATIGTVIGALFTPIGLIAAGIVGLAAVWIQQTGGIATATNWLAEHFAPLADDALTAFDAIAGALAAGNISGAAAALWGYLQTLWARGRLALLETWNSLTQGLIGLFYDARTSLARGWIEFTAGLEIAFETAIHTITTAWESFQDMLRGAWSALFGWIETTYLNLIGDTEGAKIAEAASKAAAGSTFDQSAADRGLQDRIAAIGARTSGALGAIDTDATNARTAAAASFAADTTAAQEDLNTALANFATTIEQTRADTATAAARPEALAKLGAVDVEALDSLGGSKTSATGTFSAAAATGLATHPAEETNRILRRIEAQGQLAFR